MRQAVSSLELVGYLGRIGFRGRLNPSAASLAELHQAHATHIPFENLDVLAGRPIRLDLESLFAKLVGQRRGGYCFEHNLLLAAVLERAGYRVTRLAARVRYRSQRLNARTHMLLKVQTEDGPFLADVGFGAEGLIRPIPFQPGEISEQFGWQYRLVEEAGLYALQSWQAGAWLDLYAFSLEPQEQIDYEVGSYYVSTHPDSIFVKSLTAQRATTEGRHLFRGREYIHALPDRATSRVVSDDAELLALLADPFGIKLPAGMELKFDGQTLRVPG